MSAERAGRDARENREIKRSYASVVRELRRHTSRELVLLIMWRHNDPSVTQRHQRSLLDIDARAARAILNERHSRA